MAIVRAMTRIPYARREELGPEGQQLWDAIVSGQGDLVVTADGGLAGPFNAFVTVPGAGRRMSSLGATLRFGTTIERRLSEIAIITIGARWQAEFEWWAHAPMARQHGVADAVVDAIGRGADPPFEADDERAVYAVARQLGHSGRLDQETYDVAHRLLGDAGMVELVSLCGYYTMISFLLNTFAVPLPAGAVGSAPGRGRLAGRRVLVVGAGTRPSPEPDPPIGNGRAISVLAAREGAAVACADRDAGAAEATAALVRREGQIAAVVVADVASPEACASVVVESAAALGGLDGLVLNVGIGLGRGVGGTSAAQWDQTFAVNTRAHFLVAAAALPVLEPGSAIVFISSAASLRAATGIPAYDASKAALLGLCRQVAREGMAQGIRANLVVPGLVDTPLGREASRLNPGRTARALPFGRQATAWEVAYAAVWLMSGEASYVNAHPLILDGGATSFG